MKSPCHNVGCFQRLLIVAGLLLLTGATSSYVLAADLEEARQQFKTGQYAKCLESANTAIDEGAYLTEWRILAIRSLMALGRYEQAAEYVETTLRQIRASVELLGLAHTTYQSAGQSEKAQATLRLIYRIASTRRAEYMNSADIVALGRALLLLGAEPRVVLDDFYSGALENEPNCLDAHLAAGELAIAKQDFDLAANQFREGLKRFGDNPDLHCGLARAFYYSDRSIMLQSLHAALVINPHHAETLVLLAEHQIDAESYDAAGKTLQRVFAVNPWHPEAWACRAVLAHLAADPNEFELCRTNALKYWDTNPGVDHLIGKKLSQKYRFLEGAAAQRRSLKFDPDHIPAKIQLAQDLLRLGQEREGWTLAEEVNEKDPYNVEAYNLASLHDKSSKFKTLVSEDFIVRMDPLEADVYGDQVMELLAQAKAALVPKYGLEVVHPATLELFANQQDFAVRTFGIPGGDGFLGVCFGNVITANSPKLERPANWKATLWHEYCHVVTLNLTGNRMPRWLSEGISVYEEQRKDPTWGQKMTPQYREMILGGELTPISQLSSAFLNPATPLHLQFAYYESSLVVEFIVERFGFASLKAILADLGQGREINAALAEHTGPLKEIEKDFEAFARKRAESLAPDVDWEQPDRDMVNPADPVALAQWLAEHPNNFWALQWQAAKLIEEQKWQQAKAPLKKLIAMYPGYVEKGNPYTLLAEVHRELDETEQESEVLSRLAAQAADASGAYERLMEIGIEKQDWPQVTSSGQRYMAVYPMLAAAHWRLGQAHEHLRQKDQAIASYQRLLLLDPADPVEVNYRLATLLRNRDGQAARRHLLEALADAPRFREGHRLLLEMSEETETTTVQEDMP